MTLMKMQSTLVDSVEKVCRNITTVFSSYCLSIFLAVDDTDNVIVDSGCHYQDNAFPGIDAEICVCGGYKCNTSSRTRATRAFLATLIVTVFGKVML